MKPYIPLNKNEYKAIFESIKDEFDYAEIFCENKEGLTLIFDDRKLENVIRFVSSGTGIRLLSGDKTIFYSIPSDRYDEIVNKIKIKKTGDRRQETEKRKKKKEVIFEPISEIKKDFSAMSLNEKADILKKVDNSIREKYQDVLQVTIRYSESMRKIFIVTDDENVISDITPGIIFAVNVCLRDGEEIRTGYKADGGQYGLEFFNIVDVHKIGLEAARIAAVQVGANPAPCGRFPVVISSSAGGTMIHEACGHGLEADLVEKGFSVYKGKTGKRVASGKVTVIDNGRLAGKRGSASFDDEGIKTEKVVLIENGILKGFLHSKKTAKKMNTKPTGNSRRESYSNLPIPRMRNTMINPGNDDPLDIIKSVEKGILVKNMGGGEVDPVTGNFVFYVGEAYLIEKGEIKEPIRGAILLGSGPEVLLNIEKVGNDLGFNVGTCGKEGQGVPVSDAQPTILIKELIVGGQSTELKDSIRN
ncbi:MAG: TldD/PmbA family protein [Candidatus Hydrogenedentota bacterium]